MKDGGRMVGEAPTIRARSAPRDFVLAANAPHRARVQVMRHSGGEGARRREEEPDAARAGSRTPIRRRESRVTVPGRCITRSGRVS
jgi:hypothetical protein